MNKYDALNKLINNLKSKTGEKGESFLSNLIEKIHDRQRYIHFLLGAPACVSGEIIKFVGQDLLYKEITGVHIENSLVIFCDFVYPVLFFKNNKFLYL